MTGAAIELAEMPSPNIAAAIVPTISRRISHSPSTLAGIDSLLNVREPGAARRQQLDLLVKF
jgi:hypothetical protein